MTLGAGLVGQIGSGGRMPWIQTEPEMERRKFVEAALRRDGPMAEVCKRFGVSRKTDLKDAEAPR